jgi:hypothetical protein
VNQIFALSHLTVHNLTKLTIDKHSITNQVLRSPPTPPEMTSLHQQFNQEHVHEQERAVEELQHSRWTSTSIPSSGSQVIVDRLPSQPLSRRQSRRGSASGRLQRINSKRLSRSGDSPPLQPLSRRRSDVGLELSGTRWSSGSQAASNTASSQALVRH